jgi:hypothetical protein
VNTETRGRSRDRFWSCRADVCRAAAVAAICVNFVFLAFIHPAHRRLAETQAAAAGPHSCDSPRCPWSARHVVWR